MSTLKVAVVGTGGISNSHIPGWQASEHAELVAGCDLNEQGLQAWGKKHGVTRLHTDVAEIFKDSDVDIIDICTPNMAHTPLAKAALSAGKHVICEKPLAPTPEEVRELIKARDASGAMLMTAQHHRFQGISKALKQEIDAGRLGDVYHARAWYLRRAGFIPTPAFCKKSISGGGPCIDIGVHILDLALWLMGNPEPVTVSGVADAKIAKQGGAFSAWGNGVAPADFDVEDFAAAFVRFENGAVLMLETSWLLHHDESTGAMKCWIYGTKGGALWPDAKVLYSDYDKQQMYTTQLNYTRDEMEPHALECVEFARAIAQGAPSPVPAEQSLQVMRILDGIYRSQAEGKEVRV